ncbi:MAG: glycine cleavage system protein GcvH [Candidatus Omnitrophota bacterium]|jgi:glycine cleavage system H protein|nr:MAG: glycine cleavage system protein GcvH [Candidatus Omnitrophota bacterium]
MAVENLKYTESHEWAKMEGNIAIIGITDHAQEQLTDVVFVELPEVGRTVGKGDECGVIESCKIAAELYAPLSGTITEVNHALSEHPEYINQDPYEKGWIVKIELSDPAELDALMDAAAYGNLLEKEN